MAGGEEFHRSERKTPEMAFVELDGVQQILAEVNFSTFEQRQYLAAGSFADPYLNIRVASRVTVQKLRQDAFDVLRRAGNLQDAGITMTEQLRLLCHGARAVEKNAASREQLLAFAGQ